MLPVLPVIQSVPYVKYRSYYVEYSMTHFAYLVPRLRVSHRALGTKEATTNSSTPKTANHIPRNLFGREKPTRLRSELPFGLNPSHVRLISKRLS